MLPRPTSTSRSDSFVSSLRSSRNDGPLYSLLLFPSLFPYPFPLTLPFSLSPHPPLTPFNGHRRSRLHKTTRDPRPVCWLPFFFFLFRVFFPFFIYTKRRGCHGPTCAFFYHVSGQSCVRACMRVCMCACVFIRGRERTTNDQKKKKKKKKRRLKLYFFSSPKFAISTCVRVFFFRISGHLVLRGICIIC